MVMPLFPGALDDAGGKFLESDLFSSIDPEELKAFDASFPLRQEVYIFIFVAIDVCMYEYIAGCT